MKKQAVFPLICLLFIHSHVFSQGSAERIFVQTDRDYYMPGETISFNGFVLSAIDSVSSRNLFVELWDDSLRQLSSITLPLIDGVGAGAVTIPRELKSTQFFIRAYSDVTARQTQPYQFVKTLYRSAMDVPVAKELIGDGGPVFFPEGGSLVNQALNHVVFKAGSEFRGSVRNSKGETIATLNPVFNGMGSFTIIPVKGETYTCYWEEKDRKGASALPSAVDIGIALHIRQTPDTMFVDLDNGGNPDLQVQQLKIHLMISNELAYMVEMKMANRPRFSYFIPLQEFRAGRAELRVLGADSNLLASRPVFINRHSLEDMPEFKMVKKDFSARGENSFHVKFSDTTIRLLSVSVTDAAYSKENIGSGLAASFLAPGGQPVPAAFSRIKEPAQMDLAVQVAGTMEPDYGLVQQTALMPSGNYLQLEGTIKKGRRALAEKNLLVGIRSAQGGKELYKVRTDENGKFIIDGLILYGDIYVHCRIPGNELKELNCTFSLKMPSIEQPDHFFARFEEQVKKATSDYMVVKQFTGMEPAPIEPADTLAFAEKSITLSEVVLTANSSAQALKRLRAMEEKYIAASDFSGYYASGETLDVLNDPERIRYFDLFRYMRAKLTRVDMRYVNGAPQLFYFGRGATGEMMITLYYINNTIVDRNQLDFVSLDQVAAIKFVQNLAVVQGLPPAVAVFLKKPGDEGYWEKDRFQIFEQKLTGYPVPPEFREPDYRKEEARVDKDLRKTISWKPNTYLEKGESEIHFYNNDRTKKIRIIAEGITADGSLVYVEKEIE